MSQGTEPERGTNPDFFDMADALIKKGNELLTNHDPSQVSASMLYAAARYNSFAYSLSFDSVEKFRSEKHAIMNDLTEQYRAMLNENLEYYIKQVEEDEKKKTESK